MNSERFKNRAIIFPEGAAWIVQALDRDICAQGATVMEAIHSFERTVAGEVVIGNYGRIPPAPIAFGEAQTWLLEIRQYAGFTTTNGLIQLETQYRLTDRMTL